MERINQIFSNTNLSMDKHPTTLKAAAALFAAFGTAYLYNDYRAYMALGPGGIPHNALGWLIANTLKLLTLGVNVQSIAPYDKSSEPSYLKGVLPSDAVKRKLVSKASQVYEAAQREGFVVVKTSGLERQTPACFVSGRPGPGITDSARQAAQDTRGEFAHVHTTGDHSLHVILSPADCKKVMEAGWGQRHAFDGNANLRLMHLRLPMTYLMIYAPRDDKEIDLVCDILKASIRYMTGHEVHA